MTDTAPGAHAPRTAFLHVDYRSVRPIDESSAAEGEITEVDVRKFFVAASMTAADGTLLSEANGLTVRLPPHQP